MCIRDSFQTSYGSGSRDFDYYDPAYRYGYNLAIDERYDAYDSWDEVERDAQNGWAEFAGSVEGTWEEFKDCLLYTSPSPRDRTRSRMPSSA